MTLLFRGNMNVFAFKLCFGDIKAELWEAGS